MGPLGLRLTHFRHSNGVDGVRADEGCLESCTCYGPKNDEINLSEELEQAIRDVLFDYLADKAAGWSDGYGSFGLVEIDVATGVATFNHCWRVARDDEFEACLREGE